MRLSTKGRFAVTAMIDVALREKLGPVPLSDIALLTPPSTLRTLRAGYRTVLHASAQL